MRTTLETSEEDQTELKDPKSLTPAKAAEQLDLCIENHPKETRDKFSSLVELCDRVIAQDVDYSRVFNRVLNSEALVWASWKGARRESCRALSDESRELGGYYTRRTEVPRAQAPLTVPFAQRSCRTDALFSSWCTTVLDGFHELACENILPGKHSALPSLRHELASEVAAAEGVEADFEAYMKQTETNG